MRAAIAWQYIGYQRNPSPPDEPERNGDMLTVDLSAHRGQAGQWLLYSAADHSVCVVDAEWLGSEDAAWQLPACTAEELAAWLDAHDEELSDLRDAYSRPFWSTRDQSRIERALDDSLDAVGEVH